MCCLSFPLSLLHDVRQLQWSLGHKLPYGRPQQHTRLFAQSGPSADHPCVFLFGPCPVDCADGIITATIVLPSEGEASFGALMKTPQDVRDFFGTHYPSAFGREGPSEEVAKDFLERR